MIRAKTSDPLPAGYVTTMVTGRVGQSCAAAVVLAAASAAMAVNIGRCCAWIAAATLLI
jgi:hypothetical protein